MILGSARDKLGIQTEGLNYSKLPDRMYSVNFKSSTKSSYILSQYSEQFVKNPSYQAGEFLLLRMMRKIREKLVFLNIIVSVFSLGVSLNELSGIQLYVKLITI